MRGRGQFINITQLSCIMMHASCQLITTLPASFQANSTCLHQANRGCFTAYLSEYAVLHCAMYYDASFTEDKYTLHSCNWYLLVPPVLQLVLAGAGVVQSDIVLFLSCCCLSSTLHCCMGQNFASKLLCCKGSQAITVKVHTFAQ